MSKVIPFIEQTVCGAFLPAVLFLGGAVLFLRLGRYVFSPRFFFGSLKKKRGKGALSSLWLALGGTLGVGNICGVASAVYVGGAGCVFWIWVCAIFSSVTKYAETVLAIHYRTKNGFAHSYISEGLKAKRLATFFCILCIITAFTMGNVTQVKAATDFVSTALDVPEAVCAFAFFATVLALTLGKGGAIKAFTSYAVPLLCTVYVILCCALIFVFRDALPSVTRSIFSEAFNPQAGICGFFGYISSDAVRLGITRGVTSNEAGCGTAPIAYASDESADEVPSGLLGVVEVLVDTLLLCTLTAYAVLLPGNVLCSDSATSVIRAFESAFGAFIAPVIAISVFLFALASVSAWAFYAERSAKETGLGRRFNTFFTVAYPVTAFSGCFASEKASWLLSDLTVSLMAIINIIAVLLLLHTAVSVTKNEAKALGLK